MTAVSYEHRVEIWAEKRAAIIDDIEFLLSCGEGAGRVADRLGYSTGALEKRCYRAGRRDLGSVFGRANNAHQRAKRRAA